MAWPVSLGLGAGGPISSCLTGLSGFTAPRPNGRHCILVKTPGWMDSFGTFDADDDDVATFDLTRLLSPADGIYPAETIATVSFALSVVGPSGVSDSTVGSRLMGWASIEGSKVSQRFGNWQALPFIKYLATATMVTSRGNTITASGYLPVRQ